MSFNIEQLVFWTCAAGLGYVYVGYPIVVLLVSLVRPKIVFRNKFEPKVTVLITAFNEQSAIAAKLENTLSLVYPADKLEVIVASDGSTDDTDEIVRSYASRGVIFFRQEGRVGKTITQNNAVEMATGEIILFSDATTEYPLDVLRRLLPSFSDNTVGCVAGRLIYADQSETNVSSGAVSYWNYETFLKSAESTACSLIGASGCLYAVRRSAYEPMYAEACSDFLICTMLFRKGLRSVFEPGAICRETTNDRTRDEMRMRVRVIAQTFTDLWRNRDMMNPFRSGFFAVQLISHKLMRYAVPVLLAGAFAANVMLAVNSPYYFVTLLLQVAFYGSAAAGWLLERLGLRLPVLVLPLYFVLANAASLIGFYKFVRGERFAAWEPIREPR